MVWHVVASLNPISSVKGEADFLCPNRCFSTLSPQPCPLLLPLPLPCRRRGKRRPKRSRLRRPKSAISWSFSWAEDRSAASGKRTAYWKCGRWAGRWRGSSDLAISWPGTPSRSCRPCTTRCPVSVFFLLVGCFLVAFLRVSQTGGRKWCKGVYKTI